jgi:DNA polymerase-3 subunit delta
LKVVAAFKPAYLIHGEDHGRVAERRGRLRALAEAESGGGAVEVLEGGEATPAAAALALNAMTFAIGRRFVIVDGVERWSDADVTEQLAPVLGSMPPDTTIAFFACEEPKAQAPRALHAAVAAAGGDVSTEKVHKPRDLPRWAVDQASRLGIKLDGSAAQALIAQVGDRQQRLLRELEKLALEHGPQAAIGVTEVEESAASSAERQVWGLADAVVARDRRAALSAYGTLRAQGEDVGRLIPLIARRLREVAGIATKLEAGAAPAEVKAGLRMSPYAADRRIREAREADPAALRAAVAAVADLELATRGGSELSSETEIARVLLAVTG